MILRTGLFTTLLLASLTARADLKFDILEDKVNRLDREMVLLQKKVYRPESPTKTSDDAPASAFSLDEIYTRLDEQTAQVAELTARLDETRHQMEKLQEQLTLLKADTDLRFEQAGAVPATLAATVKQTSGKGSKTAQPAASGTTAKSPAVSSPAPKQTAKEAYDAAYALLKKGDYKDAEAAFSAFLKNHAGSALAGNANYWLGESFYARGQYGEALGIFAQGVTQFKSNAKAPDNLLKMGMTLKNLGEKEQACTAFQTLESEFPKASQTLKNRAKAEMKKLSCS